MIVVVLGTIASITVIFVEVDGFTKVGRKYINTVTESEVCLHLTCFSNS